MLKKKLIKIEKQVADIKKDEQIIKTGEMPLSTLLPVSTGLPQKIEPSEVTVDTVPVIIKQDSKI